jgi:selenocysteine-specific elongation factor
MQAPIISTVGPAKHGKTALVRALTELEARGAVSEPQAEQGVVELGFAFRDIAGQRFGIVDLPGNERLVRGLLSDVHGFDLVLLVVAADLGIDPQTEECVDLLHLLGAGRVVIVLTRSDLVTTPTLDERRAEVAALTAGTSFAAAPVHVVSSETGAGIDGLRSEIVRRAATPAARDRGGWFRMFVDRSFFVPDRGLTVIGTALAGTLRAGDAVALRPGAQVAEARMIQVHGESVAVAGAGQRMAVQLGQLPRKVLRRGVVVTDPQVEFATDRFDCWLETRPTARAPLRSFDRVELDVGTVETAGSVVMLAGDQLAPGESGFCQIALERDVIVAHGDRFVLRPDGGTRTTGGGVVLHPFAVRHRTDEPGLLERLERLRASALPPRVLAFLELLPEVVAPVGYVAQALGCTSTDIRRTAGGVPDLIALPAGGEAQGYTTRDKWQTLVATVAEVLTRYHRTHPLEAGMEPEALRARLRVPVPPRLLDLVVEKLVADQTIVRAGDVLHLPKHRAAPPGDRRGAARAQPAPPRAPREPRDTASVVLDALAAGEFTPPDLRQLESQLAIPAARLQQVLAALAASGRVVAVAPDLHFDRAAFERAQALLVDFLGSHAEITVAEYRTLLGSSRKYAIALLDHFDAARLTVRVGDARRLHG